MSRTVVGAAICGVLLVALLATFTSLPTNKAAALVHPVTITIDGAFTDWSAVLANTNNTRSDTIEPAEPDPAHAQADISQVSSTFDATHYFGFVRFNSVSERERRNVRAYLDLDGDGRMQSTDRVAIIVYDRDGDVRGLWWAGYTPQDPAGDLLRGDGFRPPGTISTPAAITGPTISASSIIGGAIEFSLTWAQLGVPPGSPINIQFAALRAGTGAREPDLDNTSLDNAPVLSMRHFGVTLTPNNSGAVFPGEAVTYTHTVANTGNGTETFNLTASSSLGWSVVIRDAVSGEATSAIRLARGGSRTINVVISAPGTAPPGAIDVTTVRATHATRPAVTATATNTTRAVRLLLYSDASLTTTATAFDQGATAWAQGSGLQPGSNVRFRWLDPLGATAAQSGSIAVGADGRAASSHALSVDAPSGDWTVAVVDASTGNEIVRTGFEVRFVTRLSLTLPTALVDFGALMPDSPSATEAIDVVIDANVPYTLTRTVSGDVSAMGFAISGDASRSMPAGPRTITDSLWAVPPWTTDPGVPLEVTIRYTLVP
ncbi:MAG: hypothetical protein KGZ89_06375 [Actinobacteria bacterium]|nr:hypothetical protein [Actinomycetota bacterium]